MAISLNASGDHVDDIDAELDALRAVFARPGWTAAEAAVTDENGTSRVSLMPAPPDPRAVDAPGVPDPAAEPFTSDPTGI